MDTIEALASYMLFFEIAPMGPHYLSQTVHRSEAYMRATSRIHEGISRLVCCVQDPWAARLAGAQDVPSPAAPMQFQQDE